MTSQLDLFNDSKPILLPVEKPSIIPSEEIQNGKMGYQKKIPRPKRRMKQYLLDQELLTIAKEVRKKKQRIGRNALASVVSKRFNGRLLHPEKEDRFAGKKIGIEAMKKKITGWVQKKQLFPFPKNKGGRPTSQRRKSHSISG